MGTGRSELVGRLALWAPLREPLHHEVLAVRIQLAELGEAVALVVLFLFVHIFGLGWCAAALLELLARALIGLSECGG